jgi:signal transduction histidine kinase
LLDFSRRRPAARAVVDLCELVAQTVKLLGPAAHKKRVDLQATVCAPTVPAYVDVGQMQQSVTNLVMNAIQAVEQGGKITVEVHQEEPTTPDTGPMRGTCIAVHDNGPGIAEEDIDHVFEPFFTTKEVGEGTGLGLAVAQGLVTENGGVLRVTSVLGHGACFTIVLPALAQEAS